LKLRKDSKIGAKDLVVAQLESHYLCKPMEQHLRYNPFVNYFTEHYGCRLQKVVVNAGFTCPNRDGSLGTGGCTYCDNDAFHPNYSTPDKSIGRQIDEGIEFHKVRYHKAQQYIAYFQPFSNTYAPLCKLKEIYAQALAHPDIRGIVIGTRPDCVDNEKLDWLQELSEHGKIVIIEYGIESVYNKTLERIHRGHNFETAAKAIEETARRGITQCGHFIFGLPGETAQEMEASVQIINGLPLTALKFHQLQIIKGTRMEKEFAKAIAEGKVSTLTQAQCQEAYQAQRQAIQQYHQQSDFITFTLEEYIDFIAKFIARLRPDFYIDRFAGEVPSRFVNETPWGLIRYQELRTMLEKRMEELNIRQGDSAGA